MSNPNDTIPQNRIQAQAWLIEVWGSDVAKSALGIYDCTLELGKTHTEAWMHTLECLVKPVVSK